MVHLIQRETFSVNKWNGKHTSCQTLGKASSSCFSNLFSLNSPWGCSFLILFIPLTVYVFGGAAFLLPPFPPALLLYHHSGSHLERYFKGFNVWEGIMDVFVWLDVFLWRSELQKGLQGCLVFPELESSSPGWSGRVPGKIRTRI